MANSTLREPAGRLAIGLYLAAVAVLTTRIAQLDGWGWAAWAVVLGFAATYAADRVESPRVPSLLAGVAIWGALTWSIAYLPDLWFRIANRLNHAENYLWRANDAMAALPFNDGRFLWSHQYPPLTRSMRWIYITGFDMVVWIPLVRSLVAFDAVKVARYSLAAHLVQFPMIMPFYTAIRVDEVWSVLGHPDRCERGWTDETRLNLGANCFPSMHTSVAFAVLLLATREKSRPFRWGMIIYATAIIVSTVYMEIHWLVDVAAGLLLGLAAVRVVDWGLSRSLGRIKFGQTEPARAELA
jgi:membrane-associated phospholipid phosphatase